MPYWTRIMNFSAFDSHLLAGDTCPANPKVSVCLITYRHADYLTQCLDSILEQKTNFPFEIVIGEDGSKDETTEIVKRYALAHPEKIRAFVRPQNIGAKLNFMHALFQCKGEYIVHIEGDDFFTDSNKLQLQADYLDQHRNLSACFHNAEIQYEAALGIDAHLLNDHDQAPLVHTQDFLQEKETWFMATAAVMIRRQYLTLIPEWFLECKSGDIPLYVILAEQAPIGYLPKVMSVYRKHLSGLSFTDNTKDWRFLKNRIFMYSQLDTFTKGRFKENIQRMLKEYYFQSLHSPEITSSPIRKIQHFIKAQSLEKPGTWKQCKANLKAHYFDPALVQRYLEFRGFLNRILGKTP